MQNLALRRRVQLADRGDDFQREARRVPSVWVCVAAAACVVSFIISVVGQLSVTFARSSPR